MSKASKFVAFSTQKGGAGKTTMTVITASWLHYVKGYDVAVVDCDYPQYSIANMRERDLKMASEEGHFKNLAYEQFSRLNKNAYPIMESSTKEAIADAEYLVSQGDFDFVFFDLPGTMNDPDLIRTAARMDYIIAPICADRTVIESTLDYAASIKEYLIGKYNLKGLWMLWNMVDGRERSELYGVYNQVCAAMNLPVLRTFIPNSLRFRREQSEIRREVFRSTLFPIDRSFAPGSNIDALTDELIELFNSPPYGKKRGVQRNRPSQSYRRQSHHPQAASGDRERSKPAR
jgi:cellulose biosynthesis protein BcsQ